MDTRYSETVSVYHLGQNWYEFNSKINGITDGSLSLSISELVNIMFLGFFPLSLSLFFLFLFPLAWDGTQKIMDTCTCTYPSIHLFIVLTSHVKILAHMFDSCVRVHNSAFSCHCAGKVEKSETCTRVGCLDPCICVAKRPHAERMFFRCTCAGLVPLGTKFAWRRDVFHPHKKSVAGVFVALHEESTFDSYWPLLSLLSFSPGHVFPRTQQAKKAMHYQFVLDDTKNFSSCRTQPK